MASFVVLINWTDKGIAGFRDSAERAGAAEQEFAKIGVTLKDVYWTIGPYDVIALAEAPDDETMEAGLLKIGSLGNVRTTTLRAFTRDEYEGILAKVG